MSKIVTYLILSIGMFIGAYVPVIFGTSVFGLWSILGALIGGMVAVYVIYRSSNW